MPPKKILPLKKIARTPHSLSRRSNSTATFPAASEEMRHWSAVLAAELNAWPRVTSKPMFGLVAFYRGKKIFAALPKTRGLKSASSFIVKFKPMPAGLLKRAQTDSRMDTNTRIPGAGWFAFELGSEADLRDGLFWLNQAYDAAAK